MVYTYLVDENGVLQLLFVVGKSVISFDTNSARKWGVTFNEDIIKCNVTASLR